MTDPMSDALASLAEASARLTKYAQVVRQLEQERLELVRQAREAGASHAQIAAVCQMSRARACQLAQAASKSTPKV